MQLALIVGIACAVILTTACSSESIDSPPLGTTPDQVRLSELRPGPHVPDLPEPQPVQNPALVADGKRLFGEFNCSGCHAAGGGAIGPPLIDDEWIYGSNQENIVATILEGRPQGMPSFGGRVSREQARRIAEYVRSLAGLEGPRSQPRENPQTTSEVAVPTTGIEYGREVFLKSSCPLCHTIRGTRALATVGPDLTHVGSRETLAGILPNSRGNLAGWILNPNNLKPGTAMPPTHLEARELDALVSFLESLK